MSLSSEIDAGFARVAAEIKTVRTEIGSGGGGGGLPARASASYATAALANSASETGAIALAKSYRLLSIATDRPCRVRVYATVAQRTADAARAIGTGPAGNHGLMLEYVSTAAVLTAALSPAVDGANLEASPSTSVPISVQNLSGSTSTVQVSFVFLGTE